MCLVSFAVFLRFSKIVSLKRSDFHFHASHVNIFIEKSKTDQLREGNSVLIARTNSDTCPVHMLKSYLLQANIANNSQEFIFRSVTFCKGTNTYLLRGRTRELLLDDIGSLGFDKAKFGLHSLRDGGATAAANAGINDRLFKKHGRWASDTAKDGYVCENINEKLLVTQNLGL